MLGDVGRESEANLHYYSKYHIAYNVPTWKNLHSEIDGTNNCCMFTLPLKGWYRSLSATHLSIFEIGVYCLNFYETWHLSFVVNLKFIKQFRTLYKKWRHIVTIPFHFEINVFRVFQLAWITIYSATFKIKGELGRHQVCNLRIMLISPLISHGLTYIIVC